MATGTQRRQWTRFFISANKGWISGGANPFYEIRTPRGDYDGVLGAGLAANGATPLMRASSPKASYAAYTAIWNSLTFDPATGGPTTYYQTCQANGVGTALTVKDVRKTLSYAGAGNASVIKGIALGAKTTTGTGSASLQKGLLYTKLVQVVATGTSSLTYKTIIGKLLQVVGTGSVSVTKSIGKTLVASGTGAASVTKRVAKTLALTATGAPTLTDVYSGFKLLQVNATGAITNFTASFIPGGVSAAIIRFRRALLTYIRRR
jgi:hypothetical protein